MSPLPLIVGAGLVILLFSGGAKAATPSPPTPTPPPPTPPPPTPKPPTPPPAPPPPATEGYVLVAGDTVPSVAKAAGMTVPEFLKANPQLRSGNVSGAPVGPFNRDETLLDGRHVIASYQPTGRVTSRVDKIGYAVFIRGEPDPDTHQQLFSFPSGQMGPAIPSNSGVGTIFTDGGKVQFADPWAPGQTVQVKV